jgi:hypothetical protein
VTYVLVEEVHYSHLPPWPATALETGNSLQRRSCVSFADDPANWQASIPTPGDANAGAMTVDTDGDGAPDELEFIAGTDAADSQDFLKFDRVTCEGTNCALEFRTHADHLYTVERLSALWPVGPWVAIGSDVPGNDSSAKVLDARGNSPAFYRLRATRQ